MLFDFDSHGSDDKRETLLNGEQTYLIGLLRLPCNRLVADVVALAAAAAVIVLSFCNNFECELLLNEEVENEVAKLIELKLNESFSIIFE